MFKRIPFSLTRFVKTLQASDILPENCRLDGWDRPIHWQGPYSGVSRGWIYISAPRNMEPPVPMDGICLCRSADVSSYGLHRDLLGM